MPGLMLVLLLGAVLAVGPVRGEEGDCPEFECPAKVLFNNLCTHETRSECRLYVINFFKSSQSLSSHTIISLYILFLIYPPPAFLHLIIVLLPLIFMQYYFPMSSLFSVFCLFICSYLSCPDFLFCSSTKRVPLTEGRHELVLLEMNPDYQYLALRMEAISVGMCICICE